MSKSVFFKRIILLMFLALLLSGALSAGLYAYVMQVVYVRMQADELLPIAHMLAEVVSESDELDMELEFHPFFGEGSAGFLGAQLHVYDAQGTRIVITRGNPGKNGPPPELGEPPGGHKDNFGDSPLPDEFSEEKNKDISIGSALQDVLAGKEITTTNANIEGRHSMIVGVPVWNSDETQVIGAVLFTKSISDFSESLAGMRVTLIMSSLLSFLIMLIPGFFMARKLVVPIMQMRDVSLHMAKGDFSRRADESQKGEIGELAASINRFAEESQRLEKTRQDYVANVSHELRTPISAMRAMSETLSDGIIQSEEKKQQYYNLMLRESMRLSRLVNDLLELSRLQAGGIALQKTSFPVADVLRHCADVYGEMAGDADIQLHLDADLESLGNMFSNPDRIEQVLVVLLDNAIAHTSEGGTVHLRAVRRENHVEVSVQDHGEGIPEEDLPYVFDRFYKVDKSHSSGGTGLGLSIAKEIVDLLGEEIWVTSQLGEGSCFFFTVRCQ